MSTQEAVASASALYENIFDQIGASTELLELWFEQETSTFDCAIAQGICPRSRQSICQLTMYFSKVLGLQTQAWFTAMSIVDRSQALDLRFDRVALSIAVVHLIASTGSGCGDFGGSAIHGGALMSSLLNGIPSQTTVTRVMVQDCQAELLERISWRVVAPTIETWYSAFLMRLNALTHNCFRLPLATLSEQWVRNFATHVEWNSALMPVLSKRTWALGLTGVGLAQAGFLSSGPFLGSNLPATTTGPSGVGQVAAKAPSSSPTKPVPSAAVGRSVAAEGSSTPAFAAANSTISPEAATIACASEQNSQDAAAVAVTALEEEREQEKKEEKEEEEKEKKEKTESASPAHSSSSSSSTSACTGSDISSHDSTSNATPMDAPLSPSAAGPLLELCLKAFCCSFDELTNACCMVSQALEALPGFNRSVNPLAAGLNREVRQ